MRGGADRERRSREATERQALRDTRSDEDQLGKLEFQGHGHCKEAEKLRESVASRVEVTYILKINGKGVDVFQALANVGEEELRETARAHESVRAFFKGERIRRIVVALGKSINVKG